MRLGLINTIQTAPVRGVSLAALIRALFANDEAGLWLDPSDSTTLFQDSAGTTPAGIGDPARLALDKSQGLVLGPELFPGAFVTVMSPWVAGSGTWSIDGSQSGNADLIIDPFVLTVGKTYEYLFTISGASGNFRPFLGNTSPISFQDGTHRVLVKCNANYIYFRAPAGIAGTMSEFSVRELPGNHALAPSDAARPLVVEVDGDIAIRRDLIDDRLDVNLPAITNGKIIIGTTQGVWVDDLNFAGGTFSLGPTTYTGGPAGLYEAIGADELGTIILDRQPTAAELTNIMKWFKSKGAPDNLITEPF